MGESISILRNPLLENIDGLSGLEEAGYIDIAAENLVSINGLRNLKKINGFENEEGSQSNYIWIQSRKLQKIDQVTSLTDISPRT